jgi:hypothetical protein
VVGCDAPKDIDDDFPPQDVDADNVYMFRTVNGDSWSEADRVSPPAAALRVSMEPNLLVFGTIPKPNGAYVYARTVDTDGLESWIAKKHYTVCGVVDGFGSVVVFRRSNPPY